MTAIIIFDPCFSPIITQYSAKLQLILQTEAISTLQVARGSREIDTTSLGGWQIPGHDLCHDLGPLFKLLDST